MPARIWFPNRHVRGFTLIEVIGALVIFSVGVLMVLQLSGALGTQMVYSARRSEIVILGSQTLDSLEATPADSLTLGTRTDTVTASGASFERVAVITQVTPLLLKIDLSVSAIGSGTPSFAVTTYAAKAW